MLTVQKTSCGSSGELLDCALDTAEFYGFTPLADAFQERKPSRVLKQLGKIAISHPTERRFANLTKQLIAHGFADKHKDENDRPINQPPIFLYDLESAPKRASNKQSSSLGLHVVGAPHAMGEGVILAALNTFLRESNVDEYTIHINSLGDRETSARFMRELTAYLRGAINDMPAYARDDLQSGNTVRAFKRLAEKNHPLVENAPNPMEYLNDESRTHLRDVLEHVESIGAPYELNPHILGSNDCWMYTVIEVRVPENGSDITIARGGRFNTLANKGYRKDLPAVGIYIDHEVRGRLKPKRRKKNDHKVFFAQLGGAAKLRSFDVLENLRSAGVPISQMLAVESIGAQLKTAEQKNMRYAVIMGHKEALEETAIVRNMKNRSQVVIPLGQLAGHLKRLRVV